MMRSFALSALRTQRCLILRQVDRRCHLHLRRLPRRLHASAPDPEQVKKMQEEMEAAMKTNPQVKDTLVLQSHTTVFQMRERMQQMQEAMKNPQVRQQVENTMAYMQSEETQQRLRDLREDPELKEKFEEIEKGGFGAMMRAMSDVKFLEKVGRAVGPPSTMPSTATQSTPTPSTASAPPVTDTPTKDPVEALQMPEINTILDAAKYGDIEAVEDFLAIGKDPNLVDEFSRTPLHFAVTIQHMEIIDVLLSAGANIEMKDVKNNTPLHYAAGYGRVKALARLIEAGADGSVKNENGKTPADVARLSDQNPILQDAELIEKLDELAKT